MVIITLEQCLKKLSSSVKDNIIKKQDEILIGITTTNNLDQRLLNQDYRRNLLKSCSDLEKKYMISFINKYNAYLCTTEKEEQTAEEKLALLLLRQKGLLFKVDIKKHEQSFVMPIEVVESYFESTFHNTGDIVYSKSTLSTKKYLYYILELLLLIKEKKVKRLADLHNIQKQEFKGVDWALLLGFIEDECLVKKENNQYFIVEESCTRFFKQANMEIKQKIARFFIISLLKNSFSAMFINWVIFRYSNEKGIPIREIVSYLKQNDIQIVDSIYDVLKQLKLFQVITIDEEKVYLSNDDIGHMSDFKGIESGILQFLIPIYVNNSDLWTFCYWGEIRDWESMAEIIINKETIRHSLQEESDIEVLVECLQKYLPKITVESWRHFLVQWKEKEKLVNKKENIIFYAVTEKLYRSYIVKKWSGWILLTKEGILIEKDLEVKFENLLKELSVVIVNSNKSKPIYSENKELVIINEFPQMSTTLPEIEKVPKQWFRLTAYEERVLQRIVKQAIVLKLPIQIQLTNEDKIKLFPIKLCIKNGTYEIKSNENDYVSFSSISKLAIVHPLGL